MARSLETRAREALSLLSGEIILGRVSIRDARKAISNIHKNSKSTLRPTLRTGADIQKAIVMMVGEVNLGTISPRDVLAMMRELGVEP